MSKSIKVLWLLTLILSCVISSFAQNKLAFVNKHHFADDKTGIRELVEANKQIEIELKPLINEINFLNKKLEELATHLQNHGFVHYKKNHLEESEKKYEEAKKLTNELVTKNKKAKTLYEKRKAELIIPINKRIKEKLKEFAKQNNYEKIFDLSENELEDSALLYTDDPIDVTEEFIKFCNEEFEKEKLKP